MDERIARQHQSPTFGAREPADIQRHEIEDWLHGLSEKGIAPATCNHILAVFKTICSLAAMRGLLPAGQSPCAGVSFFKIHDLRYTFASFLANAGHSLYEAQKMLGYGAPRTTMRYAHLGQTSLLAAGETVNGFFSPRKSSGRIQGVFPPPAGRNFLFWENDAL